MDDEEQCCGSGCNNCILDKQHHSPKLRSSNKCNIFDQKYRRFIVDNITNCTQDVSKYIFKYFVENDEDLSQITIDVSPGHHLMLRASCEQNNIFKDRHDKTTEENYVSRRYTPILINSDSLSFEILVKFECNGLMSSFLKNLKIGDITEWKGVYGEFEHNIPNSFKYMICICHGVAIAPIYRIISEIVGNDMDDTIVNLLACFKNLNNILLRDEMLQLQCYWNFKSKIYLSREKLCKCNTDGIIETNLQQCKCLVSNLKYNEIIYPYRLDKKELSNAFIGKDKNTIRTLICGTEHFVKQIQIYLQELNIKNENIFIFK